MRTTKLAVFSAFWLIVTVGSVSASPTYTLHDGESGPLDFIAVQVVSGDSLAPPTFLYDLNGSPMPGWTQQGNATTAYAIFASADSIDFDITCVGSFYTANTNLLLYGFSSGNQVIRESLTMGPNDPNNGGGNSAFSWDYLSLDTTSEGDLINAVPEPATLSLLGLGLAGLIARRKRK